MNEAAWEKSHHAHVCLKARTTPMPCWLCSLQEGEGQEEEREDEEEEEGASARLNALDLMRGQKRGSLTSSSLCVLMVTLPLNTSME